MSVILALLAATAVPQAAAPAAPPQASEVIDPARLAAAKRLLSMMSLQQTLDRMFVQLAPGFATGVIGAMAIDPSTKGLIEDVIARDAGNHDRMVAILSQEFLRSIQARYPELLARAAEQYARAFTAAELTAIADFYATGPGAKALALMPQLQASMSQAGQELGKTAGMEAGRRAFERIAKEMLPKTEGVKS